MNEEEAIKELRNSYELHQCKWAKRCLDIIQEESEKKDKMIDLMAETLSDQFKNYEPCWLDDEMDCKKYKNCKDCIKQYFERKVENG